MPFEEKVEYIKERLSDKGINKETQDYVVKYVYLNQKIFKNTLDVDKVIGRIVNNLNYNIKRTDFKSILGITLLNGSWNPYDAKIRNSPLKYAMSLISKKWRQRNDSTIMHELDHCATTEYFNMSEEEKEHLINGKFRENENSRLNEIVRNRIEKMYKRHNGILAVSGIQDFRQIMKNGIGLRKLNEGIIAYKQGIYDEFLGNKAHTSYKVEKNVASFIANTIGRDTLISMHFNNDYDAMRGAFKEKTGSDLNELVKKLNKKSNLYAMMFGKIYTKNFSAEMDRYMESLTEKENKKWQKRNTDFIPKVEIDYSKVEKNMVANKEQVTDRRYRETI